MSTFSQAKTVWEKVKASKKLRKANNTILYFKLIMLFVDAIALLILIDTISWILKFLIDSYLKVGENMEEGFAMVFGGLAKILINRHSRISLGCNK